MPEFSNLEINGRGNTQPSHNSAESNTKPPQTAQSPKTSPIQQAISPNVSTQKTYPS